MIGNTLEKKASWPFLNEMATGSRNLFLLILTLAFSQLSAQTSNYQYTKNQHQKEVIGYFTQWDAWKGANHGVPKGFYNQLNIDYSQYTMLNWSFFGVAVDGSLHSGDLRDPNIHQQGVDQQPGELLFSDTYSSWDYWLLYGDIQIIHYLPTNLDQQPTHADYWAFRDYHYKGDPNGTGWINTQTNETGSYPLSLPKPGGAKGVMELAHDNGVKLMASIGGWSMSKHFPDVAADSAKRKKFVEDCQKLINMGFDGIDIDWEFPGAFSGMNFTGSNADYANFQTLMTEIRAAIGPNKLLTAAFNASSVKLNGFNWSALSTTMDYFNMMTYDMHGGWSNKAGHNSPLYPYTNEEEAGMSWDSTFKFLVSQGVNPSQINMGVAFYGRGVITNGSAQLNAPTVKVSKNISPDGLVMTAADYTNWGPFDGTPTHYAIKNDSANGWTYHWDNEAKVPYLTKGNYFLSYDNVQSVEEKAKYVNTHNIGGVIIWHAFGDLVPGTVTQTYSNKLPHAPSTSAPLVNALNRVFVSKDTLGGGTITPPPASHLKVVINNPANGQVISQTALDTIPMAVSIEDTSSSIVYTAFTVNNTAMSFQQVGSDYTFDFVPSAFGNYTLAVEAANAKGDTLRKSVAFSVNQLTTPPTGTLITATQWDSLFPYRHGGSFVGNNYVITNDFFSYNNFISALGKMANIEVTFERRCATNLYKITRKDKTTGVTTVIRNDAGFDGHSAQIMTEVVDYGNFANTGSLETKQRDLMAFLANISQETTGGWPTAPGGQYAWGLHFKEEQGYAGTNNIGYVDAGNAQYPAVAGKSYHGRGPIQLSWNYNYGQVSEFLYGDKNVLLSNPDLVASDGVLAFQTAIWFWMTPQYPKPSCHDVMVGNWVATPAQIQSGLRPGFGATVNIINGGIECNGGTENAKVLGRIAHFDRYTDIIGIGMALDGSDNPLELGCANMPAFQIDYQECNHVAGIAFQAPVHNSTIAITLGDTVPVAITLMDPNNEILSTATIVEGVTYTSASVDWTPSAFTTYTLEAIAYTATDSITASIQVTIIDESTSTGCEGIAAWDASLAYPTPNQQVAHNNKIYKNKWYANPGEEPGVNQVWEFVQNCGTSGNLAPVISGVSPADQAVITAATLAPITLVATVTDDDAVTSVDFAINGQTLSGSAQGSLYSTSWTPAAYGNYSLTVTATDNDGASSTSVVTFTVQNVSTSQAPVVGISYPLAGADLVQASLQSINLQATATDADGDLATVQFQIGGQTLNAVASGNSYSAGWTPAAYGSFSLTAIATDSTGKADTASVSFSVSAPSTTGSPCDTIANWVPQVYATAGSYVKYDGKVYHNDWWLAATDTPGVSTGWKFDFYCNPSTEPKLCGYRIWDAAVIYATGYADTVVHNGDVWVNQWYANAGDEPGVNSVWVDIDDCSTGTRSAGVVSSVQDDVEDEQAIRVAVIQHRLTVNYEQANQTFADLFVLDLNGRVVMQEKLELNTVTQSFDASSLHGIYIVRMLGRQGEFSNQRVYFP
ncbi:hypothetical protein KFE98_01705 [bacterium SCSIO 12741]|nr:hypothetical protein KFE98_01705 [bacterium SCSIO 12741]